MARDQHNQESCAQFRHGRSGIGLDDTRLPVGRAVVLRSSFKLLYQIVAKYFYQISLIHYYYTM